MMAESFDVAARLAESRPAVDHLQDYVRACGQLGYQHPDLTQHAYQLEEWYGSEDGLDLRALDADCAALRAAAATLQEALWLQDKHRTVLAGAWQGLGANTSLEVLRRHGGASVAAADTVRVAGNELAALRDELWQLVDAKAAAVQAIDDRRGLQRGQWLAAANTVTTGAGDQSVASELVDQEIKPFVDNDVRDELVAELRGSLAAVTASFEKATAGLAACPAPPFEPPGALTETAVGPAAPASPWTASGAPPSSPPGAPAPPLPDVAATAPAAATPAVAPPPTPVPPPLSSPAGGVSGSGAALSGLGRQLAGLLGGLFDSSGDGLAHLPDGDELPDPGELGLDAGEDEADGGADDYTDDEAGDEPEDEESGDEPEDEESDDEDRDDEDTDGEDTDDTAPQENPDDTQAGAAPVDEAPDAAGDDSAEPPAAPLAAEAQPPATTPPPSGPAPVAAPPAPADLPGATPCEIAADELPHAGE